MGDAVLQEFRRSLPEARPFIKGLGVGLGLDADGPPAQPLLRRQKAPLQQLGAQPLAAPPADDPPQGKAALQPCCNLLYLLNYPELSGI